MAAAKRAARISRSVNTAWEQGEVREAESDTEGPAQTEKEEDRDSVWADDG